MPEQATVYQEGQTATSKDGKKRVVFRNGMWVADTSYRPPAEKADTTAQDRTELNNASARAASERDALRTYSEARQAVSDMGTGPTRAAWLDFIVPEEDGGFWDGLGAVIGTPFRALTSQRTLDARDHLKTVNANVALAGSQQMKGSSSDKDTALMRLSGIGPAKGEAENLRIIKQAEYNAGLEQARALTKANWIGKYGSLSEPSGNGMTFEQALRVAEQSFADRMSGRKPRLPKAPPRKRRANSGGGGEITIDLNGRPIE